MAVEMAALDLYETAIAMSACAAPAAAQGGSAGRVSSEGGADDETRQRQVHGGLGFRV